jgi:hypothetical protein
MKAGWIAPSTTSIGPDWVANFAFGFRRETGRSREYLLRCSPSRKPHSAALGIGRRKLTAILDIEADRPKIAPVHAAVHGKSQ